MFVSVCYVRCWYGEVVVRMYAMIPPRTKGLENVDNHAKTGKCWSSLIIRRPLLMFRNYICEPSSPSVHSADLFESFVESPPSHRHHVQYRQSAI